MLANRQYPQVRVMAAGWSTHDRCLLCLRNIVEADKAACGGTEAMHASEGAPAAPTSMYDGGETTQHTTDTGDATRSMQRKSVVATQDQTDKSPIGNLYHRGWACMSEPLATARTKWAPEKDIATAKACDVQGNPAWERSLFPKPPRPMRPRAIVESFRWIVEPVGRIIEGDVYPDGSALDGPAMEFMRCGWAFVVLTGGSVTAAACGAPPPLITDIAGAEAWAMLQAAIRAFPGRCTFRGDCKSCIDMIKAGLASATSAKRVLARVYALLILALEDTDRSTILWMPAHNTAVHVGKVALRDGSMLTADDLFANDAADGYPKEAVEEHKVPKGDVKAWKEDCAIAKARAKWLVRVATLACNVPHFPFSDSEATRWRSDEAKWEKLGQPSVLQKGRPVVAAAGLNRGHTPVRMPQFCGKRSGWKCST